MISAFPRYWGGETQARTRSKSLYVRALFSHYGPAEVPRVERCAATTAVGGIGRCGGEAERPTYVFAYSPVARRSQQYTDPLVVGRYMSSDYAATMLLYCLYRASDGRGKSPLASRKMEGASR